MADAPDLTLFHSEDLESRLTSLNTAFYAEKENYPRKSGIGSSGQMLFNRDQTVTLTGYASTWRVFLVSQHYSTIHGLCMITVAPNTMYAKTDIGGINTHLTFSVSGNDLIIKADQRINATIMMMGTS